MCRVAGGLVHSLAGYTRDSLRWFPFGWEPEGDATRAVIAVLAASGTPDVPWVGFPRCFKAVMPQLSICHLLMRFLPDRVRAPTCLWPLNAYARWRTQGRTKGTTDALRMSGHWEFAPSYARTTHVSEPTSSQGVTGSSALLVAERCGIALAMCCRRASSSLGPDMWSVSRIANQVFLPKRTKPPGSCCHCVCGLVWSVFQVMVFGAVPFNASSIESLFEAVGEGVVTIPDSPPVSPELRDFLRQVLQPEWQDRISVRQMLVSDHLSNCSHYRGML